MRIDLPRMDMFDLNEVPSNFRELVQTAFAEYTEGTNPDYMYQDKLCYIDTCIERLHKANEDNDIGDMIIDMVKYELGEQGQLPTNEEVFGYDGLIMAYREGKKKHELYSHQYGRYKHDDEKCMKLLCEIIKAVMDYEDR